MYNKLCYISRIFKIYCNRRGHMICLFQNVLFVQLSIFFILFFLYWRHVSGIKWVDSSLQHKNCLTAAELVNCTTESWTRQSQESTLRHLQKKGKIIKAACGSLPEQDKLCITTELAGNQRKGAENPFCSALPLAQVSLQAMDFALCIQEVRDR